MKKCLSVFLVAVFGVTVFAQSKKIDSLRGLIETHKVENQEKVNLFYQIHKEFGININYDSMLFYQKEANRVAKALNDKKATATASLMEGIFYNKKRDRKNSIKSLKKSELLLKGETEPELKELVYSYLGVNYYMLGYAELELDSSLFYFKKSAKESQLVSVDKVARSYTRIAQAYSALKNRDSAFLYMQKLQELATSSKSESVSVMYLTSKFNFFKKERMKDSSFYYMRKVYKKVSVPYDTTYAFKHKLNGEFYNMGGTFFSFQEMDSSLVYLDSCINLSIEIKDVERLGKSANVVYYILGSQERFEELLDVNQTVLNFAHQIGDSALIAKTKIGATYIYDNTKEYDKAIAINNDLIENYLRFLSGGFKDELYVNQCYFYYENGDYFNAIKYGLRGCQFNSKNPNALYNLADAYLAAYKDTTIRKEEVLPQKINLEIKFDAKKSLDAEEQVLDLAKRLYEESISLLKEQGNFKNLMHPHNGLGDYYYIIGDDNKVIYHYEEAWRYSVKENVPLKDQLRVSKRLYSLYKTTKDNKKALNWLEITDSLEKEQLAQNNLKELGKKQAEYEFSQKLYADSLKQKEKDLKIKYEKEQQELKLESEQTKRYYLYGGLLFLVLFLLVLYRRFQLTLKQKKVIELQKESIEEKRAQLRKTHEGIQDSINYSKRIQKAVFPSGYLLKDLFPESFIFFRPKDVVSGDFYWYAQVGNKRVFVTADCTGHGVPGAFMTIIGINIIKEILQEGILNVDQILKEINKRLIERLSLHNESSVKDGMDLSLCVIDDTTIEFAGAHLPLYHVRNGELVEYKGSNIFLGAKLNQIDPKVHVIPYQKGDLIYMTTDGLPDQKGGEKGKKFYAKRLRTFLLEHSNLSMLEQEKELQKLRKEWIGDKYEQLDDMTVVGIKL